MTIRLPTGLARRVRHATAAARRSWALGLVVILPLAVWVAFNFDTSAPDPADPWFEVTKGDHCLATTPTSMVTGPRCSATVEFDSGAIAMLAAEAKLARRLDGVAVVRGVVGFTVPPHAAGTPFSVEVSHGSILATGSDFEVQQADGLGSVRVSQGTVIFRWLGTGGLMPLSLGETLTWPRTQPSALDVAAAPSAEAITEPIAPDFQETMQRLFLLRSQGRHLEAIDLLRTALAAKGLDTAQEERLSFELGGLLGPTVGSIAACAHHREHLRRFPDGALDETARRRLQRCPAQKPEPTAF